MSTEAIKVSVGFPVYNGGDNVCEVLDELLNQTHQNIELIISDNCSTDSTESVCREYAAQDDRVRYIRQEKNLGAEGNFAFVLGQVSSDYYLWAAADDRRSPDFIELNLRFLANNPDYAASTCPIRYEDGEFDTVAMGDGELDMDAEGRLLNVLKFWHTNGRFYSMYRMSALKSRFEAERYLGSDFSTTFAVLMAGKYHRTTDGWLILGSAGTSKQPEAFFASYSNGSRLLHYLPFYKLSQFVLRLSRGLSFGSRWQVLLRLWEWNKAAYAAQNPRAKDRPGMKAEQAKNHRRARRARIKSWLKPFKR